MCPNTIQHHFVNEPDGRQHHGASLIVHQGRVWVAWFAGSSEGDPDSRILVSSAPRDELLAWSAVTEVDGGDGVARWNPVLDVRDGKLDLYVKRGERIGSWRTWRRTLASDGSMWLEAEEIVPGESSRGPVRNHLLRLADGTMFAPTSFENWDSDKIRWDAGIDMSDDEGKSWTLSWIPRPTGLRGAGLIQPALWLDDQHRLHALLRSSEGVAYHSESACGRDWSTPQPTTLSNPNSALDVEKVGNALYAAHNVSSQDWGSRNRLLLSRGDLAGTQWTPVIEIDGSETGESSFAGRDDGVVTTGAFEYSYPSMKSDGDSLLVAYSWQRQAIRLAEIRLAGDDELHIPSPDPQNPS